MARLKKKGRYLELLRRHFLPEEARELSKFKSLKYNEVRRMSGGRQLFYNHFRTRNPDLEPGTRAFYMAFRDAVRAWYKRNDLTTFNAKMQRIISPWDWVDRVAYSLPEELRYTAKGRRKDVVRGGQKESPSQRAQRIQWIHQLKDTLAKNPNRASQLVPQIINLGGRVPAVAMRKAGL